MRRLYFLLVIGLFSANAYADWHAGTVSGLGIAYDGQTIAFQISGWSRTNCTCYSPWAGDMCLDRTRVSFPQEYASLLRARATGQKIQVNIDETTCKVVAFWEDDVH